LGQAIAAHVGYPRESALATTFECCNTIEQPHIVEVKATERKTKNRKRKEIIITIIRRRIIIIILKRKRKKGQHLTVLAGLAIISGVALAHSIVWAGNARTVLTGRRISQAEVHGHLAVGSGVRGWADAFKELPRTTKTGATILTGGTNTGIAERGPRIIGRVAPGGVVRHGTEVVSAAEPKCGELGNVVIKTGWNSTTQRIIPQCPEKKKKKVITLLPFKKRREKEKNKKG